MIWFTSDFHFGHNKEFIYGPRGFDNCYDSAAQIIKNCQEVISWDDTVYILGDVMLNDDEFGIKCLRQIPGYKYLVVGNHDTNSRIEKLQDANIFFSIDCGRRMKYKKWTLLMSHYPQITENYQDRHKVISLCGHSHTKDPFLHWDKGLIYHVEVDAHNGYPVSIDQIESDIRKKLNI